MTKNLIALSFMICSIFAHSQSDEEQTNISEDRSELKINGLFFILGAIEVDYQYLINSESGVGVDVLYAYDDENLDINYHIAPYYRQYFGKKYASGFFVEGFGMLNSVDDYSYDSSYDPNTDTYFNNGGYQEDIVDFALGLGTGFKFFTNRGFVIEIDLGIGRNLFKNDRNFTIIGKGGIHLGYRF
jgi:hypothetical protein